VCVCPAPDAQLGADLQQPPTTARQQHNDFSLELVGELTPSPTHSTPSPLRSELSKGVHQFGGASGPTDRSARAADALDRAVQELYTFPEDLNLALVAYSQGMGAASRS